MLPPLVRSIWNLKATNNKTHRHNEYKTQTIKKQIIPYLKKCISQNQCWLKHEHKKKRHWQCKANSFSLPFIYFAPSTLLNFWLVTTMHITGWWTVDPLLNISSPPPKGKMSPRIFNWRIIERLILWAHIRLKWALSRHRWRRVRGLKFEGQNLPHCRRERKLCFNWK